MSPKDYPHLESTMANQQYCLKWNNHQVNLLRAFDRLLQSESFTDVTLACEGRSLRAHKVVLSACSSYFETLFEEHPDKSPIIILKDMKFAHVSQLVNFMYRGEINITQDMLSGLLRTAETLKIKGLAEVSGEQSNASQAAQAAAAAALAAAQQFSSLSSPFRLGATPQLVPSASSALTAALNAPVSAPNLAPLAALLNPNHESVFDDRRGSILKRLSQDEDSLESDMSKPSKKEIKLETPSPSITPMALTIPSVTSYSNGLTPSFSAITTNPLRNFSEPLSLTLPKQSSQPIQQALLSIPSLAVQQQSQPPSQLSPTAQSITPQTPIQPKPQSLKKERQQSLQQQQQQHQQQIPSPTQPILTPIPPELTVNSQQELPDFLQGYSVFRLNDYLGFRTRQQFWEEPAVRRIMEGIKNKEIDMKSAAEILGVSYGTLYGRYREVFGYLKHAWVNKTGRSPSSAQKERSLWDESRAQDLIQKVLKKELSTTAAAVQLGVDYNTFYAHVTDNGKNKTRVALLSGCSGGEPSSIKKGKGRSKSSTESKKNNSMNAKFKQNESTNHDEVIPPEENDDFEHEGPLMMNSTYENDLEVNGEQDHEEMEEMDNMEPMEEGEDEEKGFIGEEEEEESLTDNQTHHQEPAQLEEAEEDIDITPPLGVDINSEEAEPSSDFGEGGQEMEELEEEEEDESLDTSGAPNDTNAFQRIVEVEKVN